ncbi:MmcQ/YjbR family DNA-binding protein [Flavobacterium sp. MAH-1]|uniref:MmcQ/YjbR family DNA-binding protein n=1 Tax=Flavobacterium agri TaxID=2743471 RepID=A0A7Y9C3S3_9FLAO|nr:MmcQ/YjbR family DNA-binding protein [Flavobacterium agri]NUY79382.1 MmcQ/YjbR family DNA-binding protein [Flavobacterium agri]NYA69406.1 MmcQ/YjbR family DNA-binding protein [Flavobacterium agri]
MTDVEAIRSFCNSLEKVTEDIKWGHDLVFSVGEKMFCVTGLDQTPTSITFKVTDAEFEELTSGEIFKPAPYVARYKWVLLEDANAIAKKELEAYITQSYGLVKDKLPPKIKKQLGFL